MGTISTRFSDRFPTDNRPPRKQYIARYGYDEVVVYADDEGEAKKVAMYHFQPPTQQPHLVRVFIAKPSQML